VSVVPQCDGKTDRVEDEEEEQRDRPVSMTLRPMSVQSLVEPCSPNPRRRTSGRAGRDRNRRSDS
jgi:hypothetical protein